MGMVGRRPAGVPDSLRLYHPDFVYVVHLNGIPLVSLSWSSSWENRT